MAGNNGDRGIAKYSPMIRRDYPKTIVWDSRLDDTIPKIPVFGEHYVNRFNPVDQPDHTAPFDDDLNASDEENRPRIRIIYSKPIIKYCPPQPKPDFQAIPRKIGGIPILAITQGESPITRVEPRAAENASLLKTKFHGNEAELPPKKRPRNYTPCDEVHSPSTNQAISPGVQTRKDHLPSTYDNQLGLTMSAKVSLQRLHSPTVTHLRKKSQDLATNEMTTEERTVSNKSSKPKKTTIKRNKCSKNDDSPTRAGKRKRRSNPKYAASDSENDDEADSKAALVKDKNRNYEPDVGPVNLGSPLSSSLKRRRKPGYTASRTYSGTRRKTRNKGREEPIAEDTVSPTSAPDGVEKILSFDTKDDMIPLVKIGTVSNTNSIKKKSTTPAFASIEALDDSPILNSSLSVEIRGQPENIPKRGRGRPKKFPGSVKPKKSRGRPRKVDQDMTILPKEHLTKSENLELPLTSDIDIDFLPKLRRSQRNRYVPQEETDYCTDTVELSCRITAGAMKKKRSSSVTDSDYSVVQDANSDSNIEYQQFTHKKRSRPKSKKRCRPKPKKRGVSRKKHPSLPVAYNHNSANLEKSIENSARKISCEELEEATNFTLLQVSSMLSASDDSKVENPLEIVDETASTSIQLPASITQKTSNESNIENKLTTRGRKRGRPRRTLPEAPQDELIFRESACELVKKRVRGRRIVEPSNAHDLSIERVEPAIAVVETSSNVAVPSPQITTSVPKLLKADNSSDNEQNTAEIEIEEFEMPKVSLLISEIKVSNSPPPLKAEMKLSASPPPVQPEIKVIDSPPPVKPEIKISNSPNPVKPDMKLSESPPQQSVIKRCRPIGMSRKPAHKITTPTDSEDTLVLLAMKTLLEPALPVICPDNLTTECVSESQVVTELREAIAEGETSILVEERDVEPVLDPGLNDGIQGISTEIAAEFEIQSNDAIEDEIENVLSSFETPVLLKENDDVGKRQKSPEESVKALMDDDGEDIVKLVLESNDITKILEKYSNKIDDKLLMKCIVLLRRIQPKEIDAPPPVSESDNLSHEINIIETLERISFPEVIENEQKPEENEQRTVSGDLNDLETHGTKVDREPAKHERRQKEKKDRHHSRRREKRNKESSSRRSSDESEKSSCTSKTLETISSSIELEIVKKSDESPKQHKKTPDKKNASVHNEKISTEDRLTTDPSLRCRDGNAVKQKQSTSSSSKSYYSGNDTKTSKPHSQELSPKSKASGSKTPISGANTPLSIEPKPARIIQCVDMFSGLCKPPIGKPKKDAKPAVKRPQVVVTSLFGPDQQWPQHRSSTSGTKDNCSRNNDSIAGSSQKPQKTVKNKLPSPIVHTLSQPITKCDFEVEKPAPKEELKSNNEGNIMHHDPRLPPGWKRQIHISENVEVKNHRVRVYINSPEGKRFGHKKELAVYLASQNLPYTVDDFDFSKKGSKKSIANTDAPPPKKKRKSSFDDDAIRIGQPLPDIECHLDLATKVRGVMITCNLSTPRAERKTNQRFLNKTPPEEDAYKVDDVMSRWIHNILNSRPNIMALEDDAITSVATATEDFLKRLTMYAMKPGDDGDFGYDKVADAIASNSALAPLRPLIPRRITFKEYSLLNRPTRYYSFTT